MEGKTMTFRKIGEAFGPQSGDSAKVVSGSDQDQRYRYEDYCLSRVSLLTAGRMKDEIQDPDLYASAVAAVLSEYPKDIVDAVTDPRTGIQRRIKWLPMLNEITDACEELYAPIKRKAEREARRAETARLLQDVGAPNDQRPTLQELKDKYGDNWGLNPIKDEDDLSKRADQARARITRNDQDILREYTRLNVEPVYASNGMLVSPAMLKLLHQWPPRKQQPTENPD